MNRLRAEFTMQGLDVPVLHVHLHHAVQYGEIQILDAATLEPVHPVYENALEAEYVQRSPIDYFPATYDPFWFPYIPIVWNGTRLHSDGRHFTMTKTVPNGDYVLRFRVLEALGDPANPDHWESYDSPVMTINRPEDTAN